jgi:hypothetical protein
LSTYLPKSTSFVPNRTDLAGKLLRCIPGILFWHHGKTLFDDIQYIIKHGNIANNERVGQLWDELEKFIQELKMKVQKETYVTPVKKNLSFPAFDSKKSKPIARFKGIAG